jgi:putative transposase
LNELKNRFDIQLHEFIVMPDHIHGIIEILVDNGMGGDNKGVINNAPTSLSRDSGNYFSKISPKSNSLSIIIRSYKSCVTRNIRQNTRRGVIHNTLITNQNNNLTKTDPHQSQLTIWQRNYFERVIRNEKELNNIRQYIIDNPKNWDV